jgi:pimeloyl-ACP methyl ester carboxylesterase
MRDDDFIRTRSGARLFVRDWGRGAPVLLLPGWAMTCDLWGTVMLRLNELGLRAISYDRRGHGRSSDPGPMDYDALADDLADVMDALDLRACTVVAHSGAGGEVVRAITRHGADRIGRIVLVGATLPAPMRTEDNPDGVPPRPSTPSSVNCVTTSTAGSTPTPSPSRRRRRGARSRGSPRWCRAARGERSSSSSTRSRVPTSGQSSHAWPSR